MRQVDRLPFIFAVVLFLLAWLLGFPMRAQSAPLWDVRLVVDTKRTDTPKDIKTRAGFLKDLPDLMK